jgi:hypothetical protein
VFIAAYTSLPSASKIITPAPTVVPPPKLPIAIDTGTDEAPPEVVPQASAASPPKPSPSLSKNADTGDTPHPHPTLSFVAHASSASVLFKTDPAIAVHEEVPASLASPSPSPSASTY